MSASVRPLIASGLALAFLIGPMAAAAQEKPEASRLEEIRREVEKAQARQAALSEEDQKLADEIRQLTEKMVRLATERQKQEASLNRVEVEIQVLTERKNAQEAALRDRRGQLAQTLAALQQLSRQPPQLMLLRPASAIDTARSADLLSGVLPQLKAQAAAIKDEIATLNSIRAQLDEEKESRQTRLASLGETRAALEALQAEREKRRAQVVEETESEAARLRKLVAEAKTLEELLQKLEEERQRLAALPAPKLRPRELARARAVNPPPRGGKPFSQSRGKIPLPAQGAVVQRFGDTISEGHSKGLKIATRPEAQVVAPYDGQVVFADTFRSYGHLLIIAHGEGYHSVLAGMAEIDGRVGQWVLAGEPIGQMGQDNASRKSRSNPDGRPELYVELQHDGEAINPLPWLAAQLGEP